MPPPLTYLYVYLLHEAEKYNIEQILNGGFRMSHQQYQELLETLHECMTACNHCFDACLQEEDVK